MTYVLILFADDRRGVTIFTKKETILLYRGEEGEKILITSRLDRKRLRKIDSQKMQIKRNTREKEKERRREGERENAGRKFNTVIQPLFTKKKQVISKKGGENGRKSLLMKQNTENPERCASLVGILFE